MNEFLMNHADLDPPLDKMYTPKEASHFKEQGFHMNWMKCAICEKSGLRYRLHQFCSDECMEVARFSNDPSLIELYNDYKIDDTSSNSDLEMSWVSPALRYQVEIQSVKSYAPPKSNISVTFHLSDFVTHELSCPFPMNTITHFNKDLKAVRLVDELKQLLDDHQISFPEYMDFFERNLISLLNRKYIKPSKRIENEIVQLVSMNETLNEHFNFLIDELDEIASKYKTRKIHISLEKKLKEYQRNLIVVEADRLNEEGIRKTLDSFMGLNSTDFSYSF